MIDAIKQVEILIVGYDGVSERVIAEAENLEIIACARGGPDASIDISAASEHGIPVVYAPGRNATCVADFTFGLILDVARNISLSHHLVQTGELTGEPKTDTAAGGEREDVTWGIAGGTPYERFKGVELADKTLGVIGFGDIGQNVAARAAGFDMDICAYDPYVNEEEMQSQGVKKANLSSLCFEADFVTVHVVVTDETRGLIGREEFETMGEDTFFINTARASIIDQAVLVEQLQKGKLAGAALDVYEAEPLPENHELLSLDTVVTTPHLAGAAAEVIERHSKMLTDDVEALIEDDEATHLYNGQDLV
jgi:Phosphoglycerate dehydrogenase and related dehydrogenases